MGGKVYRFWGRHRNVEHLKGLDGDKRGRIYNKQGTNDVFRDENATSKVRMVCYTVGNATNIIDFGDVIQKWGISVMYCKGNQGWISVF